MSRFRFVAAIAARMFATTGLALLATLSIGDGNAQTATLTLGLDEAVHRAQIRSQALLASDAEMQAARERVVAAAELPDPMLKVGLNNLPVEGSDRFSLTRDFMTMQSVGVTQELTWKDKLQARVRRAEVEIESGLISREAQLAELQRETALAWLEKSYQQSIRDLLVQQVAEANLLANAAEVTYRAGRSGQSEIFAARAGVATLRDRIMEADRRIATATTQLARWLGPIAERPLDQ